MLYNWNTALWIWSVGTVYCLVWDLNTFVLMLNGDLQGVLIPEGWKEFWLTVGGDPGSLKPAHPGWDSVPPGQGILEPAQRLKPGCGTRKAQQCGWKCSPTGPVSSRGQLPTGQECLSDFWDWQAPCAQYFLIEWTQPPPISRHQVFPPPQKGFSGPLTASTAPKHNFASVPPR